MAIIERTSSPTNISDKIYHDRTSRASIVAKNKAYKDLDLTLNLHPVRKDIIPLKDIRAIKNAVQNLILTNFYERPFNNGLGANLRGLLFEPADAITELALEDKIKGVLKKEPRINVSFIEVLDISDKNSYRITVKFSIKQTDEESQVEIILKRIR